MYEDKIMDAVLTYKVQAVTWVTRSAKKLRAAANRVLACTRHNDLMHPSPIKIVRPKHGAWDLSRGHSFSTGKDYSPLAST